MKSIMFFVQNHIGFSWKGLIVFLLPVIPNILYFILPDRAGSEVMSNKHIFLDPLEHISQVIFVALLILVVNERMSPIICPYTAIMSILLMIYFSCWFIYFMDGPDLPLMMALAIVPVAYFILAELWLYNYYAVTPTVLFGIVHILITYQNGRLLSANQ